MKKTFLYAVATLCFLASTLLVRAESTFHGGLVYPIGEGILAIGGSVQLTVDRGQVSFTSTLFRGWAAGARIEATLETHGKSVPVDFGVGTPGVWPFGEFFGPIIGINPIPFPCWPSVIDPGFNMWPSFEGLRFAGSFTAFAGLETLMRQKGATLKLQIRGPVNGVPDPLFIAQLRFVGNPEVISFTAEINAARQIPRNNSPNEAVAHFSLRGNFLSYTIAAVPFDWTTVGIYGPSAPNAHALHWSLPLEFCGLSLVPIQEPPAPTRYFGGIALTDAEAQELKRGNLYVNFLSTEYPRGEIRGRILPDDRGPDEPHEN